MEPGIDKDTFKQIFRDHWDTFTAENPSLYGFCQKFYENADGNEAG